MFDALTERDGQLTDLIRQSNRVFQTTAQRNNELQQAFVVLPTFERQSQITLDRLDQFAHNTNPLVNELKPAAREISPTLIDLQQLSPDLAHLFRNLGPLVTASKAGLPAVDQVLDDARPLLGQLSPLLRQINPALFGLENYLKELNAFFANTVGATEATDKPANATAPVHYLRTTNPLSPEMLSQLYTQRIGSNRPNPYAYPNSFANGAGALSVYENRQCGRPDPVLTNEVTPLISALLPPSLVDGITQFAYGGNPSDVPAPPCNLQAKFPPVGDTSFPPTQYSQVRPNPPAR